MNSVYVCLLYLENTPSFYNQLQESPDKLADIVKKIIFNFLYFFHDKKQSKC